MKFRATIAGPFLRQNPGLGVVVGLGVAISAALFLSAQRREHNQIKNAFEQRAEDRVTMLTHELEERLDDLRILGLLCGSKQELGREEFQKAAAELRNGETFVQAFQWVPRVPRSRRAEFEQAARRCAFTDPAARHAFAHFQITELGPDGSPVRAAEREEYYPVYYLEPCAGNEAVVGFDAASEKMRRQILTRALSTGRLTATPGLRLVQEPGQQRGILLQLPVYEPQVVPRGTISSTGLTNQVRGVAVQVLRVGDFVDSSLGRLKQVGIDMLVLDRSVSGAEDCLHTYWSSVRTEPPPAGTPALAEWRRGLYYEARVPVADREWLLVLKPNSAFLAARKTWIPEGLLAGGLLLTSLLAWYLAANARRTAQLAGANAKLQVEISERCRAEQALRLPQFAMDNVGEAVFWLGADARFTYANKAACQLLGYSREELVHLTVHHIEPALPKETWHAHWEQYRRQKSLTRQGALLTKDGRRVAVELTVNHLEYEGKEYHCTFVRDITRRKQAEEALRAAEQRWRTIFEYAPDPYSLTDSQGVFIDANKAAEELSRYRRDELIGHSFLELKLLPQEQLTKAAATLLVPHAEGDATGPEEFTLCRKDGRQVPVEVRSFRLQAGDQLLSLTLTRDITERKEAEAFTKSLNALLQLLARKTTRKEYLDAVVALLGQCSGCHCVGIRILNSQGYLPYESFVGFSPEFWAAENWLSVAQDRCACTRIISARPLPGDLRAMTPNGSFYCPRLQEASCGLSSEEQRNYRGVCIQNGFESLAIVPIRHQQQTVGAIHLADKTPNKLSLRMVELLETMAPLIGEALHKLAIEEEVRWHGETQAVVAALLRLGVGAGTLEEVLKQAFHLLLVFPWRAFNPGGVLYLTEPDAQALALQVYCGLRAVPPSRVPLGQSPCPQAQPAPLSQLCGAPDCPIASLKGENGSRLVCVPLLSAGRVLGLIGLARRDQEPGIDPDHHFLLAVADVLAGIIQRRRAEQALVRSEAQVRASLREKEILLKEVHHRVKNNLQVISSLLELQLGSLKDSDARKAFQDSRLRVRTMAMVHEKLYQSADLARIDFAAYAHGLTTLLLSSYGSSAQGVKLSLNIQQAALSLVQAIPCGLIINELVSNTLKHAFPPAWAPAGRGAHSAPASNGQAPDKQIQVGLRRQAQDWVLWVQDNGVGLPAGLDFTAPTASLGMTIVSLLARQLGGSMAVNRQGGTTFAIQFSAG